MIRNHLTRQFYTNCVTFSKKSAKNAKSHSSHQWLSRQISDPFVTLAKMKNYRLMDDFITLKPKSVN